METFVCLKDVHVLGRSRREEEKESSKMPASGSVNGARTLGCLLLRGVRKTFAWRHAAPPKQQRRPPPPFLTTHKSSVFSKTLTSQSCESEATQRGKNYHDLGTSERHRGVDFEEKDVSDRRQSADTLHDTEQRNRSRSQSYNMSCDKTSKIHLQDVGDRTYCLKPKLPRNQQLARVNPSGSPLRPSR